MPYETIRKVIAAFAQNQGKPYFKRRPFTNRRRHGKPRRRLFLPYLFIPYLRRGKYRYLSVDQPGDGACLFRLGSGFSDCHLPHYGDHLRCRFALLGPCRRTKRRLHIRGQAPQLYRARRRDAALLGVLCLHLLFCLSVCRQDCGPFSVGGALHPSFKDPGSFLPRLRHTQLCERLFLRQEIRRLPGFQPAPRAVCAGWHRTVSVQRISR